MTHGQWWHVFRSNLVDGGNVNVLFEESHKQRRQRSKDQIKAGQHQFVVERLLHTGRRERVRKTREEEKGGACCLSHLTRPGNPVAGPKLGINEGKVLVEGEEDELAHANVRVAAVNGDQPLQGPEFLEGKVAGAHRLGTLKPDDSHSNVGNLNHGDIVCSVTNRKANAPLLLPHELDDLRLLERGDTAADDRPTVLGELQQVVGVVLQCEDKRFSGHDQSVVVLL